jgi:type IV pilus assembly protein PilB
MALASRRTLPAVDASPPSSTGAALFAPLQDARKTAASPLPAIANPAFLDLAVERGLLPARDRASIEQKYPGDTFAILLECLRRAPGNREALGKTWGDSLGLAYVDPGRSIVQAEWLSRLTVPVAAARHVIPLHALNDVVTVAMADAGNRALAQEIEDKLGTFVCPVFAFPDQIEEAIEVAGVSLHSLDGLLDGVQSDAARLSGAGGTGSALMREIAASRSTAEFVRAIMILALKERASDIHIEPTEQDVKVRLRVDGALRELTAFDTAMMPPVVNVIKIAAGADIGEKRKPQDGRITVPLGAQSLDFRFSCVPTIYGEKIVLRLLGQNQSSSVPDLGELGFSRSNLERLRRVIASPNGVFFVTGPTGSGKTTTLYSALRALDRSGLNVMTIEDPVEYRLPGINQVQVNPLAGVTFAAALRAFLRQDPDVILVGEIRDLETAKIAAQAALTGHLVLATMHTNNSLQAITRLIQIGVEPFLVAPSVIAVMAQRLVRRLYGACKERAALAPEEIAKRFVWDGRTPVEVFRPKGCPACHFTGFHGRLAIHELFLVDDATRDLIARNASILDIQRHAAQQGFATMRYDGFKKVLRGLTTFDEVDEVVVAESL